MAHYFRKIKSRNFLLYTWQLGKNVELPSSGIKKDRAQALGSICYRKYLTETKVNRGHIFNNTVRDIEETATKTSL